VKAILEFNLPEEQYEFRCALNGARWRSVVEDLDNELRSILKYGTAPQESEESLQQLRDKLHLFLEEEGLKLHDEE
jgi:hypothetical protein